MQKGQENLIKLLLVFIIIFGLYLMFAWASYSPLDNAWSVASSVTHAVLNKSGSLGAWAIDILLAMFGKVAFLVPLILSFSAAYVLVSGVFKNLSLKMVSLWLISFTLLMLGLSVLANVLLPNTIYYLAGGFIGGLFEQWLGDGLGQFIMLFLGMILTSVGFYFCSGQVLLQLGHQLYQWVVNGKNTRHKSIPSSHDAVQHTEIEVNEEHLDSEKEIKNSEINKESNNQFTDLSAFPRPKISGLKTSSIPSHVIDEHLTDPSQFDITVSLPTSPTISMTDVEQISPVASSKDNCTELSDVASELAIEPVVMPKIRLATELQREPEIMSETVQDEKETDGTSAEDITQSFPKVHLSGLEELPITPIQGTHLANNGTVESQTQVQKNLSIDDNSTSASIDKTPHTLYPAGGYGTSLIHPLLQKKQNTQKPTTPLPTLDLLTAHPAEKQQITEQEIREMSQRIEQELANFRVKATVEDVLVGPVVTRYEIQPAAGTIAAKITRLENDLARALMFSAIRITEKVAGKPYMGIEAPNRYRETVWLRDVLDSEEFRHSTFTLPMALGKDISGKPIVVDMTKMPHLLVAGQTGGGKSVGVNTMILSLLFKLSPEQVRFIMIDPKVVELSIYNDIPHLLTPVVTDMKKAENALRWAVEEMERRYLLLSHLSVRNIEGFNEKIRQADEVYKMPIPNPIWKQGDTMDKLPPPLEKMSYIVLVVDEFADLMMSAGKQVEDHIMRIAQKARAVGIHLILATQRPSTDVITGVIKANIPSRIAFTVASQIDSRTILDTGGAESLLGRGDMLYSASGSPEIVRVHGAFMTDDDVQRVADNWRARGKPDYIESIVASRDESESSGERNGNDEVDPLFDEIAQYMIDGGATSISGIQRRFSLGFNRAARIIDQLEEQGVLSAPDSRGKREVLAK